MSFDKIEHRKNEVKQELELVKTAIQEVLQAGQSFSVVGGVSATLPKLQELYTRETELNKELIKLSQVRSCGRPTVLHMRTIPDFSGCH